MAPDERDGIFDRALARHLRAGGSSQDTANSPSGDFGPAGQCPGPDTLAGYHERSLLPEEMNSWKEHIVGCADCQTVLSHLEATEEIPLQAAVVEKVLVQEESALRASASSQSQPTTPATSSRKSHRARLLRGARWQWLAPAGALAASVLVWIALHENRPLVLPSLSENENKIAQNRVPSPPASPASRAVPQASPPGNPSATFTKPQSSVSEYAISNGRVASEAAKQSRIISDAGATRSPKTPSDKEFSERKDGAHDASVDLLTATNQAELGAKNFPETLRKKEDAESQAANVQTQTAPVQNAQAQNQYNYAQQKVAGPGPLNQAETSKKAKSVAAAAPAAAPRPEAVGGAASSYNSNASVEVARAITNPRLISPPGSNVVWRAGRSGLIEFSKDGGSSWSRQTSGALIDLLTGSAPSDQVCWIVGRVGAILLTTDGGAHWKVVQSPLAEDLGGVRASDALHAMIWNARATKSFQTRDGGLTWFLIPSP